MKRKTGGNDDLMVMEVLQLLGCRFDHRPCPLIFLEDNSANSLTPTGGVYSDVNKYRGSNLGKVK